MTLSTFSIPEDLHEKIVFCDFDGTITEDETFVAILKEFSPELATEIIPQMYDFKITLRDGVRRIIEGIPSARFPEIIEFVKGKKIRKGFGDFLFYLKELEIPFIVISGGLRPVIEIMLEDYRDKIAAVYALDVDLSGEFIRINSDYEEGDELVAKTAVMGLYNTKEIIAIGDSLTDINMAMNADIVFARDRLSQYLDKRGQRYKEWKNFIDIRNELGFRWRNDKV